MSFDPVRPSAPLSALPFGLACLLFVSCAGQEESTAGTPVAGPVDETGAPIPAEPRFEAQEGWRENPERSPMRIAEFVLPGAEGSRDAQLAVLAWPQGVGGLEDNVGRWVRQVGRETLPSELGSEERWVEKPRDFLVTMIHVEGALQSMPGMAADVEASGDDAILAAFIEKPPSTAVWTAKVTGPADTVRLHRDRFIAFIQGL